MIAADPGDSRIVFLGPDRTGFSFGADSHRTKLDYLESAAVLADPLLDVEYRPARIELNRQRG